MFIEDLIEIYVLFIRSKLEYCSVVWHSSLTIANQMDLERVQKTCLKVILGDMYVSYESALEMCNLITLTQRREDRCKTFAKKNIKNPRMKSMFPLSEPDEHHIRKREKFSVNFARTAAYMNSAIPYLQRMLNNLYP